MDSDWVISPIAVVAFTHRPPHIPPIRPISTKLPYGLAIATSGVDVPFRHNLAAPRMKILAHTRLLITTLSLVTAVAYAADSPDPADTLTPIPQPPPGSTLVEDNRDTAPGYDTLMLVLGGDIYNALRTARQAALDQQATTLRVRIAEARDTLARLRLPASQMTLEAQTRLIRRDLAGASIATGPGLWLPVAAERDTEAAYLPQQKTSVPATLGPDLGTLAFASEYSVNAFPLDALQNDVESAWQAASVQPSPDWHGSLQALNRALGRLRHVVRARDPRHLLSSHSGTQASAAP